MNGSKKLHKSKTFWGSVITMFTLGIGLWRPDLAEGIQQEQAAIVETILGVVGIIASAFAIYGRVVADKKIGGGDE